MRPIQAFLIIASVGCGSDPTVKPPAPSPTPIPTQEIAKPTPEPASACDTLVISLDATGTWIGAPPETRCFASHADGAPDIDWIERELAALHRTIHAAGCQPGIELAAAAPIRYQHMIHAMDTAVKVGFPDVGLSDPESLAMKFSATAQPPARCGAPKLAAGAKKPPSRGTAMDLEEGRVDPDHKPGTIGPNGEITATREQIGLDDRKNMLASAPVIVVTRTEISVAGKASITVAEAAALTGHSIPALATTLGKPKDKYATAILQADESITMKVINLVVNTAKSAGYDNILFAVKNKQ